MTGSKERNPNEIHHYVITKKCTPYDSERENKYIRGSVGKGWGKLNSSAGKSKNR